MQHLGLETKNGRHEPNTLQDAGAIQQLAIQKRPSTCKLFFKEEQRIHSKSLHPQPPWLFAGEVLVLLAAGFANPSTPRAEKKLVGLI